MILAKLLRLFVLSLILSGCVSYSFNTASLPEGIQTIYIPFFPDQSNSGLSNLSNQLNESLIQIFVNQSRLNLTTDSESADAILQGRIVRYTNRPVTISGEGTTTLNQVQISVQASFRYTAQEAPLWDKPFSAETQFNPNQDPIEGENNAAEQVLLEISRLMFNDALSDW